MLAVGAIDVALGFSQGTGGEVREWITAAGLLAVGGWAIKDHLAMRHRQGAEAVELQRELEKIRMGQSDIRSSQAQMHGENQDRFQRIDLQLEGGHGFDGLVHGDRRNRVRRHFLINQLAAFLPCFEDTVKVVARLATNAEIEYDAAEIAQTIRGIITRLRADDQGDRTAHG